MSRQFVFHFFSIQRIEAFSNKEVTVTRAVWTRGSCGELSAVVVLYSTSGNNSLKHSLPPTQTEQTAHLTEVTRRTHAVPTSSFQTQKAQLRKKKGSFVFACLLHRRLYKVAKCTMSELNYRQTNKTKNVFHFIYLTTKTASTT